MHTVGGCLHFFFSERSARERCCFVSAFLKDMTLSLRAFTRVHRLLDTAGCVRTCGKVCGGSGILVADERRSYGFESYNDSDGNDTVGHVAPGASAMSHE